MDAVVDMLRVGVDDAVDRVCVAVLVAVVTGTETSTARGVVVVRRSVVVGGFVDDVLAVVAVTVVEVARTFVVCGVADVDAVERDRGDSSPERCSPGVLLDVVAPAPSWSGAAGVSGGGGQAGREDVPAPAARARPRAPAWCLVTERACSASMYWMEKS